MKQFLTFFIFIIVGCSNPEKKSFRIIDKDLYENSIAAKLTIYALYEDTVYNEGILKSVIDNIYKSNIGASNFKKHDAPNIVSIFLYESLGMYEKSKSSWIAHFNQSRDRENSYSYNLNSAKKRMDLRNNLVNNDIEDYRYIEEKLKKFNSNICMISEELRFIEDDANRISKFKFPTSTDDQYNYFDKLYAEKEKELTSRYNISDSTLSRIKELIWDYCY